MNRMSPSLASRRTVSAAPPLLGPNIPQHRGVTTRFIGRAILRLAGWKLSGSIPDIPRFVMIVAPHTSNWDFPIGLAAKWALGFHVSFLGKDTLFRPPIGWFMRAVGGIPVNRKTANAVVDKSAQTFRQRAQMVLVLAPEGTRHKVDKWRSGFWHIARAADVPIVCAAIDWGTKEVRFGPTRTVDPAVEPAVDIARIKAHYNNTRGYHPALQA